MYKYLHDINIIKNLVLPLVQSDHDRFQMYINARHMFTCKFAVVKVTISL